jgi:hypothetical protein
MRRAHYLSSTAFLNGGHACALPTLQVLDAVDQLEGMT